MSRPIVLPPVPEIDWDEMKDRDAEMRAYARAAVEADRASIVVTDEDVETAIEAFGGNKADDGTEWFRAALESFAARLRGDV